MWSRRQFLASSGALAAFRPALAAPAPRQLVLIVAYGGWDITYCFDPKLGVGDLLGPEVDEDPSNPDDREAVEVVGGHPIMVNDSKRPAVRQFFEEWGAQTDVLNGVWVGAIGHETAMVRMLTGTPSDARPDMAVITGAEMGGSRPLGCVDLGARAFAGDLAATMGMVGGRSQLALLLEDAETYPAPADADFSYPLHTSTLSEREQIEAFLNARAQQEMAAIDGISPRRDTLFSDLLESADRVTRFRAQSDDFSEFLQLGVPPRFDQSADLAAALLKNQVCQTVVMDSGLNWDSHFDNSAQHGHYDSLFRSLNRFMRLLDADGLLESTTIAVVSEMSRAPAPNVRGGKDHWPYTSAMVMGAGVRGGRTLGATDDKLVPVAVDLQSGEPWSGGHMLRPENFCAGLLETLGVDPAPWFPNDEVYRGFHT